MFAIKIGKGSDITLHKLKNIDWITKKAIRRGLYDTGKDLFDYANKDILSKNKTGKVYRIRGRRHQSSAPGQSWANLTGKARKSLNFKVSGADKLTFGASQDYAKFLEKGTVHMKPRPTLKNSINKNNRNIIKNIGNAIIEELTS